MEKRNTNTILQTLTATKNIELLPFLIENNVRKSRSAIKSLLTHKQIKVNNRIASVNSFALKPNDVVTIHKNNNTHDKTKLKGLTIVFEDEFLIVVDKESGLLSVATEKEKAETAYSVVNKYLKLKNKDARAFVLHRLDREISGLMIYAKDADIQAVMQKNWNNLILSNTYTAVVEGNVSESEGTIVSWLTEDKNYIMRSWKFDNGGLKSITHYKLIKQNNRFAMLSIDSETKRKNQLRVHMKHIGTPIVGDKKYGSKINPIKRIALHAGELSLKHPMTNEIFDFKSPIPKKMQLLVEKTNENQY